MVFSPTNAAAKTTGGTHVLPQRGSLINMYIRDVRRFPELKPAETKEIAIKAHAGNVASCDQLTEHNLPLIISLAKRFRGLGVEYIDLIQEGNLGLMKAAATYDPFHPASPSDPSKGFVKFSTWAVRLARQSIYSALATKAHTVRLPDGLRKDFSLFSKAIEGLKKQLGKEPSPEDVAGALRTTTDDASDVMLLLKLRHMTSLDAPILNEKDKNVMGTIEDKNCTSPEEAACKELFKGRVGKALSHLTERERYVISLRYGLTGLEPLSLEDIGKTMNEPKGLTRQRVFQIEEDAIEKLRNPSVIAELIGQGVSRNSFFGT
jgi:RNA polymerase primary sigma factor